METKYRINWKKGLDITPEILISSDNFHIAERNMLGYFLACRIYGVLPNSNFNIESEISNQRLTIKNLNCFALTCDGALVCISKNMRFQKELALNEATGSEFYVVLTPNPAGKIPENENDPYLYPDGNLVLKKSSEKLEFGIPVLKLKNNNGWEIDENYIPPSFSLNSVELLLKKYEETKSLVHKILDKFPERNPFSVHFNLLRLELNDFNANKSPEEWNLLLKKYCWFFYTHLKNENKISENQNMKVFIEELFNQNEIGKIFQLGLKCFEEVNSFFDAKPVEEIVEIKV